jgi:hypothetical protein
MSGASPAPMTFPRRPGAGVYGAVGVSYIRSMRTLAISLATALSLPAMAAADIVPLSELSSYLNGIDMAQSTFTQINADGTVRPVSSTCSGPVARGSNMTTTTFW